LIIVSRAIIFLFSVSSDLYIARASNPPIVRYNPEDGSLKEFSYDGSAQSVSFDAYENAIYWANFVEGRHKVIKTLLNEDTVDLNITYAGKIKVTVDVFNLYVLDDDNQRIDKYLKETLEKLGYSTFGVKIEDIIIGYGECTIIVISSCNERIQTFSARIMVSSK
jgi:hypothetical protein